MFSIRSLVSILMAASVLGLSSCVESPVSYASASCGWTADYFYSSGGPSICTGATTAHGAHDSAPGCQNCGNHGDGYLNYLQVWSGSTTAPSGSITLCMWECAGDGSTGGWYRGQISNSGGVHSYGYSYLKSFLAVTDGGSQCYQMSLNGISGTYSYIGQPTGSATTGTSQTIYVDGNTGQSCSSYVAARRRLLQPTAVYPSQNSGMVRAGDKP